MKKGLLASPLGILGLSWEGDLLLGLELDLAAPGAGEMTLAVETDTPIPAAIRGALADYFQDGRQGLVLDVDPQGTAFQRRVWRMLRSIPPGTTRTYGDLARDLDTSPRAIGGACRANPCLIAVPCHRVVAQKGLGGFAGDRSGRRLAVKRWLLRHEGASVPAETAANQSRPQRRRRSASATKCELIFHPSADE